MLIIDRYSDNHVLFTFGNIVGPIFPKRDMNFTDKHLKKKLVCYRNAITQKSTSEEQHKGKFQSLSISSTIFKRSQPNRKETIWSSVHSLNFYPKATSTFRVHQQKSYSTTEMFSKNDIFLRTNLKSKFTLISCRS